MFAYDLLGDLMLYLKKIKKYYLNFFIWFIGIILVITFLSYFNIISNNTLKVCKIAIPVILITLNSFKSIKIINTKGYLNGIIYAGLIIITLFILNLLFYRSFYPKQSLYYIILLLSSSLGSMFGNTKKSQLKN